MKTIIKLLVGGTMILGSTAYAGPSWGFTLGNGAGFYYGNNNPRLQPRYYNCPPSYYEARPVPIYHREPVYYSQPRVVVRERYCDQNVILFHSWR